MLARTNLHNVLVAGDWHGDSRRTDVVRQAIQAALKANCKIIIHTGDFGYWPHKPWGLEFLADVEAQCAEHDIEVWWVDGNHECFDMLELLPLELDGSRLISPHVRHLPRGLRFTLDGVRFGALGGAVSVDRKNRTPGESWWPQEVITPADVAALGSEPLDVLVTHDAPDGVWLKSGMRIDPIIAEEARYVRRLITSAVQATRAKLVLHGHWHVRHSTPIALPDPTSEQLSYLEVQVEGFDCDGSWAWNYGVLNLATLAVVGAKPTL